MGAAAPTAPTVPTPMLLQYIELEVAHDIHNIISTITILDDSIHSKLEVLVALNIMVFHRLPVPYSGKFSWDKLFVDGSEKMKIHRCWLTMQNENTIMPNSQILFLRMLGQP